MGKNKLQKFADIETFTNVHTLLFPEKEVGLHLKGKWNANYFKNNNPIVLELGCGKGEYTVGLAKKYPNKNFIGVDIKGNRIWNGAKAAIDEKINNVAFLRTRIDFIESSFAANEVSEIWITFPDPQPQKTRERKRLTHMRFLNRYKNLMKENGIVHLKTDNEPLWQFTIDTLKENNKKIISATNNLYQETSEEFTDAAAIKTYYENLFHSKGFDICYVAFYI